MAVLKTLSRVRIDRTSRIDRCFSEWISAKRIHHAETGSAATLASVKQKEDQYGREKRMAKFIALCYTEAFLRSRLPTISVDLKFHSLMEIYKNEDKPIAL